ncbi:DUF2487 family protein [Paenibacillus sp. YPG26]|uniref:DUF2487 family protein n=1 Tax=Paenibacillus sp. YPG26 TaxID=2878915 RepID=UPI00203C49CA|nr:DUF2487 family protein [Paenibacillus sp. YPG26]USB34787.1 YpiF family protein [Paenibacillus sp. YPG26]
MKFSEIHPAEWGELKPYLDTCLLPVTGLTGGEQPFEVVYSLERLRDVMEWVEIPFKGRVVTYPAIQYGKEDIMGQINAVCANVKSAGFKYVIVVSAEIELDPEVIYESDLVVTPGRFESSAGQTPTAAVMEEIQRLWFSGQEA